MSNKKEKIAVVASGGGMSCSYAAGAIASLVDHHNFKHPDIVIAGSGSAGTLAYYAAGQHNKFKRIWLDLLASKKFINLSRFWKIIDIDYLIDTVFREKEPLDVRAVCNSPVKVLVAVTDYATGDLVYFSNKDRQDHDEVFEILRASKALPLAFNKRIWVDGKAYCDSYLSASLSAHIREAIKEGATKVIAINNTVKRPINETFFSAWVRVRGKKFRKHYYKQMKKADQYKVPGHIEVECIEPETKLPISTFQHNTKGLKETYKTGYNDMKTHKGVVKLLNS
ncbi:hypothetical protein CL632_02315 [bacterium]|nr:hypothetical protein [bacterium]MDP6571681.1 patatin-like phospholipase family protein [Patescibacteria group bacterium]|tara:strand:+ start:1442 stop:2287 length:846 start_codon:yes stop_codon:yes gene_type:complete